MNRLARELSPYLLQHAGNPVDWFPWGDEAFAKARAEQKPIFLSVGYSTCHWCHVMEHESFEHAGIAAVLNERYVAVKVDREERPDVDRVYMAFVQGSTGSGGWPMSVWLTPDLKPFYGGTYFPPDAKWGRPGFGDILLEIARVWNSERDKILQSANVVATQLADHTGGRPSDVPDATALARAVTQFRQSFDPRHGGFGDAPKFPRPSELLFLMREHARTGDVQARDMALATLTAMAEGGVRDHVGGGFHRYSVDAAWRVPHFEKMLYDQAQLALAYIEAAQVSGDRLFLDVAEDTLSYVMREMRDEGGAFYSAEDADSVPPEQAGMPGVHKMEGAFYLWTAGEIDAMFGTDAAVVRRRFGIEPRGNAPSDPQGEFTGKNILYAARSLDELAEEFGRARGDIEALLAHAQGEMYGARLRRPRPHLDDKVLTSWNGLMIAAFARMARLARARVDEGGLATAAEYLDAAARAASFIKDRLWNAASKTLLRRYRAGQAGIDAYAEDYAFLICGVLELAQATDDPGWLEWAIALQRRQDELFWDAAGGGWFSTSGLDPSVLVRMKDEYDGAEPTASAVSLLNLIVLSHLVSDQTWNEEISRTFSLFAPKLREMGRAVPMVAAALSHHLAGVQHIVIVGDERTALERAVLAKYRPFAVTFSLGPAAQAGYARVLPMVGTMRTEGAAAAYVCANFACRPPAATPEALEHALATL